MMWAMHVPEGETAIFSFGSSLSQFARLEISGRSIVFPMSKCYEKLLLYNDQ